MKLFLAQSAKDDLASIRAYTTETFGVRQADVYRGKLEQGLKLLRAFPEIGLVSEALPPGYRAFRVEHHWICYKAVADGMLITGIVHALDDFD